MSTFVFPILAQNSIEEESDASLSINQIDFFSNRNIKRQLQSIREFNKTQCNFLELYTMKRNMNMTMPKLKLKEKVKCKLVKNGNSNNNVQGEGEGNGSRPIETSLRSSNIYYNINNNDHANTNENYNHTQEIYDSNRNSHINLTIANESNKTIKRLRDYDRDKENNISPNRLSLMKTKHFDLDDDRNPNVQLYQSIFKINEERTRKNKTALITNSNNSNNSDINRNSNWSYNYNSKLIRKGNNIGMALKKKWDPDKYSKNTKKEMKEVREKLSFLKGVVNYVFPQYLKFKIEPYNVNQKDSQSKSNSHSNRKGITNSNGFSQTFYDNYTNSNTKPSVINNRTLSRFQQTSNNLNPYCNTINNAEDKKQCNVNEITL